MEYNQLHTDEIGVFSEDVDNLFTATLEDFDNDEERYESLMKL